MRAPGLEYPDGGDSVRHDKGGEKIVCGVCKTTALCQRRRAGHVQRGTAGAQVVGGKQKKASAGKHVEMITSQRAKIEHTTTYSAALASTPTSLRLASMHAYIVLALLATSLQDESEFIPDVGPNGWSKEV